MESAPNCLGCHDVEFLVCVVSSIDAHTQLIESREILTLVYRVYETFVSHLAGPVGSSADGPESTSQPIEEVPLQESRLREERVQRTMEDELETTRALSFTIVPISEMTGLQRMRRVLMLWPYIFPLFLVYAAEYICQAGKILWYTKNFTETKSHIRRQELGRLLASLFTTFLLATKPTRLATFATRLGFSLVGAVGTGSQLT